jgi:hypothetical protein
MPIQVTCPGCHKRFSVSDKFAGQKGPCPQCKAIIQVPTKAEEVVVHAPQEFGPKDATGRGVLKPISRKETKFSTTVAVAIGASVVVVVVLALLLRTYGGEVPMPILGVAAFLLGPPLAYAGYSFLRNDELEPHRGRSLLIRSLICGAVYAGLWGLYALGIHVLYEGERFELFQLMFVVPILAAIGAATAFASFDLDFGSGLIHYSFYLLVTVLLRMIMGMSAY